MDSNSKTPAQELRPAFSRFPQEFFPARLCSCPCSCLCRCRTSVRPAPFLNSIVAFDGPIRWPHVRSKKSHVSLLLPRRLFSRRRLLLRFSRRLHTSTLAPSVLRTPRRHPRGMLLLSLGARRGLRFFVHLRRLLFLFLLLRQFLNPGKLAQNLLALFRSLPASRQLHGKHLL